MVIIKCYMMAEVKDFVTNFYTYFHSNYLYIKLLNKNIRFLDLMHIYLKKIRNSIPYFFVKKKTTGLRFL